MGQEEIPEARLSRSGLELLHHRRRLPAIVEFVVLPVELDFVGIDVLVHEVPKP